MSLYTQNSNSKLFIAFVVFFYSWLALNTVLGYTSSKIFKKYFCNTKKIKSSNIIKKTRSSKIIKGRKKTLFKKIKKIIIHCFLLFIITWVGNVFFFLRARRARC